MARSLAYGARARLAVALIVIAMAAMACGDGLPPEFPAPDFKLKSPMTGKVVTQKDIKGKPTMVYWYASW